MSDDRDIERLMRASYKLPDPGGPVVRQLLREIVDLRQKVAALRAGAVAREQHQREVLDVMHESRRKKFTGGVYRG